MPLPSPERYFVFELTTTYDNTRLTLIEQGGSQFEAAGAISALMSIVPPPSPGAYYATAGERDPLRFWKLDDEGTPTEVVLKPRQTLRRHQPQPLRPQQSDPAPAPPADELALRRSR